MHRAVIWSMLHLLGSSFSAVWYNTLKKSMQDKLMKFYVSIPPSLPSSLPTTDSMYSALSPSLPVCIHTSCIPPPCILPGTPVRHTSLPESLLTSLLSIPPSLSLFTPYLTPDIPFSPYLTACLHPSLHYSLSTPFPEPPYLHASLLASHPDPPSLET